MAEGLYVEEIYRHLHEIPETALKEYKTSEFIAKELAGFGFIVTTGIAGTGCVAVLEGEKTGTALGLRADMDSLEFEIDGVKRNIHACGHDANCSMVLSAAKDIAEKGIQKGRLVLIFQPAEETLEGADLMIKSGELAAFDELVGIHLRPVEEAGLGEATPALYHGACHRINVRITGRASHSARPHLGVNAINAAAQVINAVNAVRCDPRFAYSANVTEINSGMAANIIPDRANMTVDLRAQNDQLMEELAGKVKAAVSEGVKAYGAEAEIEDGKGISGAQYDEEMIETARRAIKKVLGDSLEPIFTPGSEDFHFYTKRLNIKSTYIGLGADLVPGLHNPEMRFDLKALSNGREILKEIVAQRLR